MRCSVVFGVTLRHLRSCHSSVSVRRWHCCSPRKMCWFMSQTTRRVNVLQNWCAPKSRVRTEEHALKRLRRVRTSVTVHETLLATSVGLVSSDVTQLLYSYVCTVVGDTDWSCSRIDPLKHRDIFLHPRVTSSWNWLPECLAIFSTICRTVMGYLFLIFFLYTSHDEPLSVRGGWCRRMALRNLKTR